MANNINIQAALAVQGDGVSVQSSATKDKDPGTGKLASTKLQSIAVATTNGVALDFGISSSIGFIFVKNKTGSNYVELGLTGGGGAFGQVFAKLNDGEFCLIPVGASTYYAKANTVDATLILSAAQI